jgi:hypothetical protein
VAPFREVARYAASRYPASAVLLTRENNIADLAGDAHEYEWHELPLKTAIASTRGLPAMVRLMEQWHIRYFVTRETSGKHIRPAAFRQLLSYCTVKDRTFGAYSLLALDPGCARPLETRRAGTYDDFDPAIRYSGDWTQDDQSSVAAVSGTLTYTLQPGAAAGFAFDGRALIYVYTKAWNRGIAEIAIDGVARGSVDLYAPRIEWQRHAVFCCFAPGRHELAIRATGRHSAAATGSYIDVDALIVEP